MTILIPRWTQPAHLLRAGVHEQARRFPLLLVFALFVGSLGLIFGARSGSDSKLGGFPDEIRARRFVAVDDAGKVTAEFGMLSNGTPGMTVWDNKANVVAVLGVDNGGSPRFFFQSETGIPLLSLGIGEKRFPVIMFNAPDGTRRLGMVLTDTGEVTLQLYDSTKQNRCALRVGKEGQPQLVLRDQHGNVRAGVMVHDDVGSGLQLLDREERTRAMIQVNNEGEPDAALLGPNDELLWSARGRAVDTARSQNGDKPNRPK